MSNNKQIQCNKKHRIINGDTVIIKSGRDKGKIGKVLRVDKSVSSSVKILVEGCAMQTKYNKKNNNTAGSMIRRESYIDISNVAFYDINSKSFSKIGYKFVDNKKYRFLKSSGEIIN